MLVWLGFAEPKADVHGHGSGHGHTHGVVDSTLATTTQGIWAIKWSFIILGITSVLQLAVVYASKSVALFADAIHNVGDAGTAIPLWIAFMLARRKASERFSYGYGRAEDLAGIAIVLIILFSALVAAYQAIDRLINPQAITLLGWVAAAGLIGFIGNESVAVFRLRIGRKINSAALIADGYHARTDGLTSLAVVLGALGVWLGYPLADPIVGLLITIAIFGIVWQSAKAVLTRALDGVDIEIPQEIRHVAEHVQGVLSVVAVRARWLGHRLTADVDVALDGKTTIQEADTIRTAIRDDLLAQVPALATVRVLVMRLGAHIEPAIAAHRSGSHRHAPAPFIVRSKLADGILEIVETPAGERLQLQTSRFTPGLVAEVLISRDSQRTERLVLAPQYDDPTLFVSSRAPEEPHELDGKLRLYNDTSEAILAFHMAEPEGHH
ncbi:MAG: cation diffusion facilitator family transporter [Betaproteobacteria bacterium]